MLNCDTLVFFCNTVYAVVDGKDVRKKRGGQGEKEGVDEEKERVGLGEKS